MGSNNIMKDNTISEIFECFNKKLTRCSAAKLEQDVRIGATLNVVSLCKMQLDKS